MTRHVRSLSTRSTCLTRISHGNGLQCPNDGKILSSVHTVQYSISFCSPLKKGAKRCTMQLLADATVPLKKGSRAVRKMESNGQMGHHPFCVLCRTRTADSSRSCSRKTGSRFKRSGSNGADPRFVSSVQRRDGRVKTAFQ